MFLYKYASAGNLEWLRPVILEHKVYAALPQELNDPSEARPILAAMRPGQLADYLKNVYDASNADQSPDQRAAKMAQIDCELAGMGHENAFQMAADLLHSKLGARRIYCTSKRWDNLAMWAKYGGDHAGYCLEFKREGPFALAKDVDYRNDFEFDLATPAAANAFLYFVKKSEWSNEEEVRLVLSRNHPEVTFEIPPTVLNRIILGCKIAQNHRAQIEAWAAERVPSLSVGRLDYDPYSQTLRADWQNEEGE